VVNEGEDDVVMPVVLGISGECKECVKSTDVGSSQSDSAGV
jgi:hypothetical protein